MADADLTNGERTAQDEPEAAQRAGLRPGSTRVLTRTRLARYVNDGEASSVAEPNEPA